MIVNKEVVTNNNVSVDFPHQFDVVFADLPIVQGARHMQRGVHPAIVLSSNSNNKNNTNITVIPITSKNMKGRHLQTHLFLNIEAARSIGLYKESTISAENTMPVDKNICQYLI